MSIERLPPPAELLDDVEFFSQRRLSAEPVLLEVYPVMRAEILINFGSPWSIGDDPSSMNVIDRISILPPRSQSYWQSAGPEIDWFLIALTPLGCRNIVGRSLAQLWLDPVAGQPNWKHALAGIFDTLAAEDDLPRRISLVSHALLQCRGGFPADRFLTLVHAARNRPMNSVSELADLAELSVRQLRDRFHSEIGLAPKEYLRIMRFNRYLMAAHPRPWRRHKSASENEYFDESHSIHEFREFVGMTPGQYRRQKLSTEDPLIFTGPSDIAD